MTIPTQADIDKRKANLEKFLKEIDPVTGKSHEKSMVSVVRSSIRKAWMRSPTKLAYLYMKTEPDMDPNTRTKWKVICECCGKYFKINEVECDHIEGHNTFTKVSDFQTYFDSILMVGFDGLQILCSENCHPTKTLAEKLDISFESAKIEREVIKICKLKASQIDSWLKERNVVVAKNPKSRRDAVRKVLEEEMKRGDLTV